MMKALYSVVGFFLFIVFVIIAIAIGGNATKTDTAPTKPAAIKLSDHSGRESEVKLTITGPVVADENHNSIRISVTQSLRTIDVIKGYQGSVVKTKSYVNNQAAYEAFLKALDTAFYASERINSKDRVTDESSSCATGSRYALDFGDGFELKSHHWTSTCTESRGTFGGNISKITSLFNLQFPDYYEFTSGLGL